MKFCILNCNRKHKLTLWLCTRGIPFAYCAIVVVVFHFKALTSECSYTPGHGNVIFFPATAMNFRTGMFVTSGKNKIKNLLINIVVKAQRKRGNTLFIENEANFFFPK